MRVVTKYINIADVFAIRHGNGEGQSPAQLESVLFVPNLI